MGILEHDAQGAAEVRLLDLVDIDTVVADLTVGDVIEAVDEVGDGGLAGAGGAYKGDLLTGLCPEADVVEHQLLFVVAKVHVVKDHAALQPGIGDGAVGLVGVPPGPYVGALLGLGPLALSILLGVDQLYVAVVLFRLLIHQIEDPLGAGGGVDHEVDLLAYLGDGLGEALVEAHKGDDGAQCDACQAVDSQDSAHNGHEGVAQPADVGVDGHEEVTVAAGHIGTLTQGIIHLAEVGDGSILMAEHLDHLLSVQHLLDETVHSAQVLLLPDIVLCGQPGEVLGHQQHHRCGEKGDEGEEGIEKQHGNERSHHGNAGVNDLRNALAQKLTEGVDVVGVYRHDVAMGVGVKILDGQSLHFAEQVVTETAHSALADVDHDAVVGEGCYHTQQQDAYQTDQGLS